MVSGWDLLACHVQFQCRKIPGFAPAAGCASPREDQITCTGLQRSAAFVVAYLHQGKPQFRVAAQAVEKASEVMGVENIAVGSQAQGATVLMDFLHRVLEPFHLFQQGDHLPIQKLCR